MELPGLARRRQRGLAFEVEMLLPAHLDAALEAVRRRYERFPGVPADHSLRRLELLPRLRDRDLGGERLGLDLRQSCRGAGGPIALRRDDEQGLARIEDLPFREELVVVKHRTDIVLARNVGGGEDRDHARRGADFGEVEPGEPCVAVGREAEGEMQRSGRLGQIVDIARAAGDMALGAVVAKRAGDLRHRRGFRARATGREAGWRRRRGDIRPSREGR